MPAGEILGALAMISACFSCGKILISADICSGFFGFKRLKLVLLIGVQELRMGNNRDEISVDEIRPLSMMKTKIQGL